MISVLMLDQLGMQPRAGIQPSAFGRRFGRASSQQLRNETCFDIMNGDSATYSGIAPLQSAEHGFGEAEDPGPEVAE